MKTTFVSIVILGAFAAGAQTNFITFTNKSGVVVSNAEVLNFNAIDVFYQVPGGGLRVHLADLPPEVAARFHYDPDKAQAAQEENARRLAGNEAADAQAAQDSAFAERQARENFTDPHADFFDRAPLRIIGGKGVDLRIYTTNVFRINGVIQEDHGNYWLIKGVVGDNKLEQPRNYIVLNPPRVNRANWEALAAKHREVEAELKALPRTNAPPSVNNRPTAAPKAGRRQKTATAPNVAQTKAQDNEYRQELQNSLSQINDALKLYPTGEDDGHGVLKYRLTLLGVWVSRDEKTGMDVYDMGLR